MITKEKSSNIEMKKLYKVTVKLSILKKNIPMPSLMDRLGLIISSDLTRKISPI